MWTRVAAAVLLLAMSLPAVAAPRGCLGRERTTNPSPNRWPMAVESHLAQLVALPATTDVLLLGDSHAANWPPQLWQPLRSFNAGNAGDWIENLLWRLRAPEWRRITPKNVVVSIGSNNLARGDCAFALTEGITTILRRVRTLWPEARVIYIGIPMRGPKGSLRPADRAAVNATVQRGSTTIPVDLDHILNCAGCFDSPEVVHLSGDGYAALAAGLKPLIEGPP